MTTAPPLPVPSKPSPLTPPIDMSRVKDEKGVKAKIKQLLALHGWMTWMPAANGYGAQGVSDHLALKAGVFLVIEAKFGYGKPTPLQCAFAANVISNSGYAFCVNEKTIDHLAWWLESFEASTRFVMEGGEPEAIDPAHGARMLNAISVLVAPFGLKAQEV